MIEDVFHGPVFDQYASSEGAPIVSECRFGQKHLHHEMGIIELDVDGEILVTSFDTHGTPLIRYRVGDRMTLSQRTCSCGHRDQSSIRLTEGDERSFKNRMGKRFLKRNCRVLLNICQIASNGFSMCRRHQIVSRSIMCLTRSGSMMQTNNF
ncbi:hypothetical protein OVA29_09590 [Exiguobacterium sp. SL14]|nr:hypothetical protein [Exiguobacterium sp. SL14]MCY1690886.1 hypothetical protein [Exiguobacterium sp. SL14]